MKELIGKKIKGFKFEDGTNGINYVVAMDNYIGKIGVIIDVDNTCVEVKFDNVSWIYPLPEALNHIVEEHDLNNTVIKVLNEEHGKQVIRWWQEQGVNTRNLKGNYDNLFYGLVDNEFNHYNLEELKTNTRIMQLPKELPQRGDEVLVWDYNEIKAVKRIFLAYIEGACYQVITVDKGDEEKFKKGDAFSIFPFKHYKPIPQKTKLTLQQIADKFGIDVNDLEVER